MAEPLITIIIPVYNSDKTLRDCLNSIISQHYQNKEVWIIDGASKDSTISIINEYAEPVQYIQYVSEKDNGVYDAMNKGITRAKGDWLFFLGSDDALYDENVLSLVSAKIIETEAKVIYGNVLMKGIGWAKEGSVYDGEFDLAKILTNNINHQSIFYHRDVFKKLGGYNLKYPVYADYDFNLRSFAAYRFQYIDAIIAIFKLGGASTKFTDEVFLADKNRNIIKYFFRKLFSSSFIGLRLYIQQAAFSKKVDVDFGTRLYCALAYTKLKIHSMVK